jgi:hypothetical protein
MGLKYRGILISYITIKRKQKMESQAIFLNPFIVCSSCKCKFIVCLFVDEETNRSYSFANGLNGLTHL